MDTVNATIESTRISIEHDALTYVIHLRGESWAQGFGGRRCEDNNFLSKSIKKLLEVTGARSWEDLPGTHVRVRKDYSDVHAIGHIIEDQWYDISAHAEEVDRAGFDR